MTAPGPAPQPNDRLEHRIAAIEQRLNEQDRKTLYSATISGGQLTVQGNGGVRVLDAEGDQTFFVGGLDGPWARPDGKPQAASIISDDQGHWRVAVWDDNPQSGGYSQEVRIWDALGHIVLATDPAGGVSIPALPVPMYSRYIPPAGPSISYVNIPVTSLATAQNIWEGRIYQVISPRIEMTGTWGAATGTNQTTYTLQVNLQTVGSWTVDAIEASTKGPFDISQWLGFMGVSVRLLVSSTGSGNAACQMTACTQRGS